MDLDDLKKRVIGFAGRSLTALTSDGVDNVLGAINDARRMAQRQYNFQMLKLPVFIEAHAGGTTYTTGCKLTPASDGTAVQMKLLTAVWHWSLDNGVYKRGPRIQFDSTNTFRHGNGIAAYVDETSDGHSPTSRLFAYVQGLKFHVYPSTELTWYMVDGIQWLPDLTDDATEDSDVFLKYGADWLLLAAVQELNFSVKEDQRVAISDSAMQRTWRSLVFMDGTIGAQGESVDLE